MDASTLTYNMWIAYYRNDTADLEEAMVAIATQLHQHENTITALTQTQDV